MADLCTLAQVRSHLEFPDEDLTRDALISEIIPRVTTAIQSETNREFIAVASATRTFAWKRASGILDLSPYDLRTATAVTIHPGDSAAVVATADDDFYLGPIHAQHGVYRWLVFSGNFSPTSSSFEDAFGVARLSIAGAWGFATVPTDVVQAAVITVGSWLARDVAALALAGLDEPRGLAPPMPRQYALPSAAWRLLNPYARRVVR